MYTFLKSEVLLRELLYSCTDDNLNCLTWEREKTVQILTLKRLGYFGGLKDWGGGASP